MDLSIYRKEAELNRSLLTQKAETAKQLEKIRIMEEKNLEQQEIEDEVSAIFDSIPTYCKLAAELGEFKAHIFTIACDEDHNNKSHDYKVKRKLLDLLDKKHIKFVQQYRFDEDNGYGEDYIKHDESYYDYFVIF